MWPKVSMFTVAAHGTDSRTTGCGQSTGPLRDDRFVEVLESVGHEPDVEARGNASLPFLADSTSQFGVVEQSLDRGGQRRRVVWRHEETGATVLHGVAVSHDVGEYDGNASAHRLERREGA